MDQFRGDRRYDRGTMRSARTGTGDRALSIGGIVGHALAWIGAGVFPFFRDFWAGLLLVWACVAVWLTLPATAALHSHLLLAVVLAALMGGAFTWWARRVAGLRQDGMGSTFHIDGRVMLVVLALHGGAALMWLLLAAVMHGLLAAKLIGQEVASALLALSAPLLFFRTVLPCSYQLAIGARQPIRQGLRHGGWGWSWIKVTAVGSLATLVAVMGVRALIDRRGDLQELAIIAAVLSLLLCGHVALFAALTGLMAERDGRRA